MSFTVCLNEEISHNHFYKQMGIKAYMNTTVEPLMLYCGEITMLIKGNIFNLKDIQELHINEPFFANPHVWRTVDNHTVDSGYHILVSIYQKYGIDYLLETIDGNFVMVILDQRLHLSSSVLYVVGDPAGTVPIYISRYEKKPASNMFLIYTDAFDDDDGLKEMTTFVPTGTYHRFQISCKVQSEWEKVDSVTYNYFPRRDIVRNDVMIELDRSELSIDTILYEKLSAYISQNLYAVFEKHISIYSINESPIYCIGQKTDDEFNMIVEFVQKICYEHRIKYSVFYYDNFDMNAYAFAKQIQPMQYAFMSSGFLKHEREIKKTATSIMDYDYNIKKDLRNWGETRLIKQIYEPFMAENIHIVFPYLDSLWINAYLSIPCEYRIMKLDA